MPAVAYVDHHGGTTEHRTAAWARCTCGWCGADHHRPADAPAAELHEMTTAATREATRHARTHRHGMFVRVGTVVRYAHLMGGREWLRITAINAYGPVGPQFQAGTAVGYLSRIRRTRPETARGRISRACTALRVLITGPAPEPQPAPGPAAQWARVLRETDLEAAREWFAVTCPAGQRPADQELRRAWISATGGGYTPRAFELATAWLYQHDREYYQTWRTCNGFTDDLAGERSDRRNLVRHWRARHG